MLEKWDIRNRKIVRNAGALPLATPVELMHLPKSEGGLGLERLRLAIGRTQIDKYVTLLNTSDRSLAAQMTRAGRLRFQKMGGKATSIHQRMEYALWDRRVDIVEAHQGNEEGVMEHRFSWQEEQGELDLDTAKENTAHEPHWEAYGDGATYERKNRAGWGVWMTDGEEERESYGRLAGKQSNDGAEARGILTAMLMIHPSDSVMIYCDNSGCISRWNHLQDAGR